MYLPFTLDRRAESTCVLCHCSEPPAQVGSVRCNVRRYRDHSFFVWQCAGCRSLHCEDVANLSHYYEAYPIRNERLDYFLRTWYRVILRRLVEVGLTRQDRILDYGCSTGLFIRFLAENGYTNCFGYDPYVERYKALDALVGHYDWVISLDVIEHDRDPNGLVGTFARMLRPGGRLCVETPNADGIELSNSEEYLHALHMPFHVHILSRRALTDLAGRHCLKEIAHYRRWYMDSWKPGTARRLAESLLKYAGNDLDAGYEPPRVDLFFRHPILFCYLLFGYFIGPHKNDHMMSIFRYEP